MKVVHIKRKGSLEEIKFIAEGKSEAKRINKLYWSKLLPPYMSISYWRDTISLVCYPIHYVTADCPTCGQKVLKNFIHKGDVKNIGRK